jgi:hypothetical protein
LGLHFNQLLLNRDISLCSLRIGNHVIQLHIFRKAIKPGSLVTFTRVWLGRYDSGVVVRCARIPGDR